MSYVLPQVQVFQEFSVLPTEVIENQNAFVFGPHYELLRYNQSDEKPLTALGAYDRTQDTSYGYPNKPSGSTIDLTYSKLYGESIWLNYFTITGTVTNPFVMVSANERNKLRAAPRIVDAGSYGAFTGNYQAGGYHSGMIALPEAYYIYPQATFDLDSAGGVMDYITTEDVVGEFDVATDAVVSGNVTEGPDGIAFDFDAMGVVKSPLTVRISDGTVNNYFDISILSTAIKAHAEAAVVGSPKTVQVTDANGATDWTDPALHVYLQDGIGQLTLTQVRAAILALPDIGDVQALFTIGAIVGSGAANATAAEDQDLVDLVAAAVAVPTMPDVIKINVFENTYVFQTANGKSRTPTLYKDIQIGDKLVYTVTPALTGIPITVETEVVGFEEDYLRPTAADPVANVNNQAAVTGTSLSGGAALVSVGPDNQDETDFDMALSLVYSLVTGEDYRQSRLTAGVLQESYTLTVTKAGIKGVAQMSVEANSGAFSKFGVPVEDAGGNAGRVYIGDGIYVDFVVDTGDGTFLLGDQYIIGETTTVDSPFVAQTPPALSGSYGGQVDTTYTATVTRGGVFDRVVKTEKGLRNVNAAVCTASLTSWIGGDVDDEYILECTSAGDITTAVFKLSSLRGDNAIGISFSGYGIGNQIPVGFSGLQVYLTSGAPTPFAVGEYFVIIVKASRPKIQITDSAGNDQESSVIVNDGVAIAMGLNGLSITFPANANGGLNLNDRFSVVATASTADAVQTLVLADEISADVTGGSDADGNINLTPDLFSADVMLVVKSQEIPAEQRDPLTAPGSYNWIGDLTQLTVNGGITLQNALIVNGIGDQPYLEVYKMTMFIEYRALLSDYAGAITSMEDLSEVTALGKNSPDNPLRLGVQAALENAGDSAVYFIAVPSDDEAGYLSVLDKASVTDKLYGFVPLTQDKAIHSLVQAHVNTMSTETNKRWRRMFVGTDQPSEIAVVNDTVEIGGNDYQATVLDDPLTAGTQYTLVEFSTDAQLLSRVNKGDTVRLQYSVDPWGNETYVTDTVAAVRSNTQLVLTAGLAGAIITPQRTEVWHTLTTAEVATAVAAISTGYGDQRVCHIAPNRLGRNGEYVDAMYGAAAIAGLVGGVPPQQGLTNIELIGFDDIPATYGVFSQSQLDEMAEAGTMIIMQETRGGEIFVRHQLTTAAGDGDLRTAELNIVKNFDSISYYFAGRLKPFIGRYNVTPDLIEVIETNITDGLDFLGSRTDVGLLGPQVLLNNSSVRTVEQHPTLKDRILAIVDLELPAPLNVIELYLVI